MEHFFIDFTTVAMKEICVCVRMCAKLKMEGKNSNRNSWNQTKNRSFINGICGHKCITHGTEFMCKTKLTSLSLAEISSQLLPSLLFTSDFAAADVFVRAFDAVVIAVEPISELVVDELTVDGIGTMSSTSSSSARFSIVSRLFSTIDTGDDRFEVNWLSLFVSILSSLTSSLLLFSDLLLIIGFPLLLHSDIAGDASDGGAKPFCMDEFWDEIFVDDNCSFNELTSFSASVALCKKKKSRESTFSNVFIVSGWILSLQKYSVWSNYVLIPTSTKRMQLNQ